MQKVSEVMTRQPATLPSSASVVEAARQMRDLNVGAVVVVDGQNLRGIVTDRDIVVRAVAPGDSIGDRSLDSVCSQNVMTVSPDDDADRAVSMMRENAVRRVPVVSGGEIVGMLSLGDLAVERDPGSALGDISSARPNN
jgi:CBS domain-containing protein